MKSTITLLVLALAASGVYAADDIYRSVMPDGWILYGESAAPGAKSVHKMPSSPASTGVTVVTPEERAHPPGASARGGVAVIPQPVRPPTRAAEQGALQAPSGLPQRSY